MGPARLVLVRTPAGVRAFDADCPHRGAHLAVGGRLEGDAIGLPFHGHRIGLGAACAHELSAREHPALVGGGAVFVCLSGARENGFSAALAALLATHEVVGGFTLHARAAARLVTENGFDLAHFEAVHDVHRVVGGEVRAGLSGELAVDATFEIAAVERLRPDRPSSSSGTATAAPRSPRGSCSRTSATTARTPSSRARRPRPTVARPSA